MLMRGMRTACRVCGAKLLLRTIGGLIASFSRALETKINMTEISVTSRKSDRKQGAVPFLCRQQNQALVFLHFLTLTLKIKIYAFIQISFLKKIQKSCGIYVGGCSFALIVVEGYLCSSSGPKLGFLIEIY